MPGQRGKAVSKRVQRGRGSSQEHPRDCGPFPYGSTSAVVAKANGKCSHGEFTLVFLFLSGTISLVFMI